MDSFTNSSKQWSRNIKWKNLLHSNVPSNVISKSRKESKYSWRGNFLKKSLPFKDWILCRNDLQRVEIKFTSTWRSRRFFSSLSTLKSQNVFCFCFFLFLFLHYNFFVFCFWFIIFVFGVCIRYASPFRLRWSLAYK